MEDKMMMDPPKDDMMMMMEEEKPLVPAVGFGSGEDSDDEYRSLERKENLT